VKFLFTSQHRLPERSFVDTKADCLGETELSLPAGRTIRCTIHRCWLRQGWQGPGTPRADSVIAGQQRIAAGCAEQRRGVFAKIDVAQTACGWENQVHQAVADGSRHTAGRTFLASELSLGAAAEEEPVTHGCTLASAAPSWAGTTEPIAAFTFCRATMRWRGKIRGGLSIRLDDV
jgi:hypothetical protein